ncbi:SDR family oxidoreductase [Pseudoxanthomonas daejeonensis]|uniref:SDR family oxidoreductase n=1 Tax=Pseudoxanthomonas daejeonensis TaxID=266062 RepID=UPI001F5454F3|nr:SDR family oxidoreductase [Pseudoxanthomonas daejeonensis]UNK57156.1 SDR family oxidoreductase [Pseudoxanthomonas daejeonensis]
MNTSSKVALVTGATRGIGRETVRQLAENGVHALLAGRNREKAVEAALELQAQGLPVEAIALDVTDAASIAAAAQEIERRYGRLDILVNNAGVMLDEIGKSVSEQSLDTWRRTFDTNVFGLVAVTQAFLPLLHRAPSARIVNVSSLLGSLALHAQPGSPIYDFKVPAYNVSKSAVNAWTVQLAYELRDSRIKVNTIHPGYVKTDMNGGEGEIEIADGARTGVRLALIGEDGPQGGYFYMDQVLPW